MKITDVEHDRMKCPECGGPAFGNLLLAEKKDACYYKVKASAKVWPSAYASGRLVQCRKKGAANYGNKSKKESVEEAASAAQQAAIAINMKKAHKKPKNLREFAQTGGGDGGDYLRTLASAWYNDVYNTGNLQKGIKSQQDVEKILSRGVVCPDGVTRKYYIDYNSDFDGVELISHDFYEHGDYDGVTDTRTGKPFSAYDHIEYSDDQLDEGMAEGDVAKLAGITALGIGAGLGANYLDQQAPKVEFDGKNGQVVKAYLEPAYSNRIPDNAMTIKGKDGKTYHVWSSAGKGANSKSYHAAPVEQVKEGIVDTVKQGAKKAWDYATEPVDAPDMDTYKKHRAKNIADIRKKKAKQQGVADGSLKEFAPGDSGDDGFDDDVLKQLAAQWYNGDEDPRVEKTLAAAGWEIGQDEGYDDEPGVFVVQAGDVNGNSYQSWPADELRGLMEKWSAKYKKSINCANPKGFSQRAHCAGRKKNEETEMMETDELARLRELSGTAHYQELAEEFDMIESIIESIAERNGVDAEAVWEDLESLTEDELYAFAVTSEPVMEDWQKVNKKDKTDGMSQKAVNAYRREHPGSKLKTAVTTKPSKLKRGSKASKRRKSYCSRSRGQMKMHSISCSKTPDKAICKARRRWNC